MQTNLRKLLGGLPVAAYTCDQNGLVTYYNAAAEKLWGRAPKLDDASDRYCGSFELYTPKGVRVQHSECWMALALRETRPFTGQEIIVGRPDGSRVRVLASASPLYSRGVLYGAINMLTEVPTTSALSEAAFIDVFAGLFAYSTDGVLLTRPDGTILRANDAACLLTGFAEHELCGQPRDQLFASAQSVVDAQPAQAQPAATFRQDATITKADGSPLPVEVTSILAARGPEAVHSLVVFRDSSARLEAERLAQVAQRMEAVGQLAGGIAHNFNNLLLVINASCVFIRQVADKQLIDREIDHVEEAIERASDLTQRLLTLGNDRRTAPRRLELNTAVRGTLSLLRKAIREDIVFVEQLASDTGHILFDLGELEQILLNFAINARDAMPLGGTLTFASFETQVGPEHARALQVRPGSYVVLEVTDTGAGISEDVLPKIFDPFFTTKPVGSGFGLGLSTVYGMVRRHGGAVAVRSRKGDGTSFSIYLPRVEGPVDRPQPSVRDPAVRGTEEVLIVDDDPAVRSALERTFSMHGYQVTSATNGSEALELLLAGARFRLLVTDVVMPVMGGAELVEHVKKLCPELPVIVISGYGSGQSIESVVALGARFIRKSGPPQLLLRAARELLGPTPVEHRAEPAE